MNAPLSDLMEQPIGSIIVNSSGFCIHGEKVDPFQLASFAVLTGEAIETAKKWVSSVNGYQVIPVFQGAIENPEFVPSIDLPNSPRMMV